MIPSLRRLFGPYVHLPQGVWALFIAILVNRAGNFVAPFLALYLTQKAGYPPELTGFLLMLLPLAVIPAVLAGGWAADRWGRKRLLVVTQALAGSAYVLASFDPLGPLIPVWMVIATFLAAAAQVAHNAMLNDLTVPENRKAAFSLNYLGINLGFSVGPMVAGLLFQSSLGLFFLVDGLTTWLSAGFVFFLTRETLGSGQPASTAGPGEQHAKGSLLQALGQRPFFVAFLAMGFLTSMVYGQHTFSLPLQLNHDFPENGAAIFGLLMGLNGITVVVATTVLTQLTARFPSLPVAAGASGLYALGFGMLAFVAWLPGSPLIWLGVSTMIWTLGEILSSVSGHVYMASHTPANHRGRFNSVRLVTWNLASAASTVLAGLYVGAWGVTAIWPVVAAVALLAMVSLLYLHKKERT